MVGWSSGKDASFSRMNGRFDSYTDHSARDGRTPQILSTGSVDDATLPLLLACSSVVEQSAVNRLVVGSIPTLPAKLTTGYGSQP